MTSIISIIAGVFASFAFANAVGYTGLHFYLTKRQLLVIDWTISAATAIITYQLLN